MSNAQKRADLATALSTVTGITGFASRPAVMNAGDAWPQWRGGAPYGNTGVIMNRWDVLVVLPAGDDVTADSFADTHLAALLEAVEPHLAVAEVQPASIAVEGGGELYALLITGGSE